MNSTEVIGTEGPGMGQLYLVSNPPPEAGGEVCKVKKVINASSAPCRICVHASSTIWSTFLWTNKVYATFMISLLSQQVSPLTHSEIFCKNVDCVR